MTDPAVHLPFFWAATKLFSKAAQRHIKRRTRQNGVLSQVGSHPIFEGRRTTVRQSDETVRETEIDPITAEFTARREDLTKLDRGYVEKLIDEVAGQFEKKMSTQLFELLNNVTNETGNVFDGKGRPLSHEMLLEVQRSMPVMSDPEDGGSGYVMIVHPDMMPRIEALQSEFEKSPELQQQFRQLREEQVEKYRSDQLARKLAG